MILKFIPNPNLPFLNFLLHKLLSLNLRNSIMGQIFIGKFSIDIDPKDGLRTYRRNLKNLVRLIMGDGGKVILSSFCHYLYQEIENIELHRVYSKIISEENAITKAIAEEEGCRYVDMASLIKPERELFLDSIHFSPKGMDILAKNFGDEIIKRT